MLLIAIENPKQQRQYLHETGVLVGWIEDLGWESLLNRRGQLWRRLPEGVRTDLDETGAVALMLAEPGLIKRPLLDTGARRVVGFSAAQYQELLG